jgi:hypothetical protein
MEPASFACICLPPLFSGTAGEFVSPESFTEYAYFSSYADSWVQHANNYTEMIVARLGWMNVVW